MTVLIVLIAAVSGVAACHAPGAPTAVTHCEAPGLRVHWHARPFRVEIEHGPRIASLYLVRGDRLWVLHASAALGTAEYSRREGRWHLARGFTFACRGEGPPCRAAFARREGWSAAVSETGGDRVFELEASLAAAGTRFTVVSLDPHTADTTPDVRACPGITGDVIGAQLQAGDPPETIDVDASAWPSVPG